MPKRKIITVANFEQKVVDSGNSFLDEDFTVLEGNRILVSPVVLASQTVQFTLDGGTTYRDLNSIGSTTNAQSAIGAYMYAIQCQAGNVFNMKIKEAEEATVDLIAELYLEN